MVLQTTVYQCNQGRTSLPYDLHVAATAVSRHDVVNLDGVRWCIT